jgi:hypothetical protein
VSDLSGLDPNSVNNRLLALERMVAQLSQRTVNINSVDELSDDLGVMRAGMFAALTSGSMPTDPDASGSFMSALGEEFPEGVVHIGGVNNGELQFGLSADDGSAMFGGGQVVLNKLGQLLKAIPEIGAPEAIPDPSSVNWLDPTSGNLVAKLVATTGGNLWFIKASDSLAHEVAFVEDIPVVPAATLPFGTRRCIYVQASNAAYAALGMAAPATSGTLTALPGSQTTYINHAISGTTGNTGGVVSPSYNLTRTAYHPNFKCRVRTGSVITNLRIWVGLFSAAPGNNDDLGTPGNFMAIRFSTVAGDTHWRAASAGTSTGMVLNSPADELPLVEVSTEYELTITYDEDTHFYVFAVNDVVSAFSTVYIPPSTTDLGFVVYAITTTASAKNFAISDVYIEFD